MWVSPSLTLRDESAKLGTRRTNVFMLRNEIIVVLPIQEEDSIFGWVHLRNNAPYIGHKYILCATGA